MADINFVNSFGFFTIAAQTDAGREWLDENVPSQEDGVTYSDDSRMTQDIYEGAAADGLEVFAVRA